MPTQDDATLITSLYCECTTVDTPQDLGVIGVSSVSMLSVNARCQRTGLQTAARYQTPDPGSTGPPLQAFRPVRRLADGLQRLNIRPGRASSKRITFSATARMTNWFIDKPSWLASLRT